MLTNDDNPELQKVASALVLSSLHNPILFGKLDEYGHASDIWLTFVKVLAIYRRMHPFVSYKCCSPTQTRLHISYRPCSHQSYRHCIRYTLIWKTPKPLTLYCASLSRGIWKRGEDSLAAQRSSLPFGALSMEKVEVGVWMSLVVYQGLKSACAA